VLKHVQGEIKRAKYLATRYGARSTPSLVVNGKYLVNLSRETLDVLDFLLRKELML